MKKNRFSLLRDKRYAHVVLERIIGIGLLSLLAVVPLIVIPTGQEYWYWPKINAVYLLLVVIIIALACRHLSADTPSTNRSQNPLALPLLAYGAASFLSVIFSIAPSLSIFGDDYREEGILTITSYILLTFLFAELNRTKEQVRRLMVALLGCCALVSLFALSQYLGFDPIGNPFASAHNEAGRVGSTLGNPNFLGKYLVLVLPIFLAYFLIAESVAATLLLAFGSGVSVAALILTFTRASWFGFAAGLALFPIFLGNRMLREKRKKIVVVVLSVILFAALFETTSSIKQTESPDRAFATITKKITSAFDLQKADGMSGRLFAWQKALTLIKERPLLGYGLDTHLLVMRKYNLEYILKYKAYVLIDRVHNNYLDIALAQGLIGLAAYLSIVITFLLWLIRTMRAEAEPTQRIVYCGILCAFCGYLLNDFFIFSVVSVSPTFWSLMGLTVAMKRAQDHALDD